LSQIDKHKSRDNDCSARDTVIDPDPAKQHTMTIRT